jgi:hypothetical protein
MTQRLRRRYGLGQLHFITCSCYRRMPLLGTERARHLFLKILSEVRERYDFALLGYVVMPEHIHLLISDPKMWGTQHGDASVEAERFASDAPEGQAHSRRTKMPVGRDSPAEIPTVLAATVLRFQCVEREEKEREDELHTFQSGKERAGNASERLALEHLRFLLQDKHEFVRTES